MGIIYFVFLSSKRVKVIFSVSSHATKVHFHGVITIVKTVCNCWGFCDQDPVWTDRDSTCHIMWSLDCHLTLIAGFVIFNCNLIWLSHFLLCKSGFVNRWFGKCFGSCAVVCKFLVSAVKILSSAKLKKKNEHMFDNCQDFFLRTQSSHKTFSFDSLGWG